MSLAIKTFQHPIALLGCPVAMSQASAYAGQWPLANNYLPLQTAGFTIVRSCHSFDLFLKLDSPIRFIDGARRVFLIFNYAEGGLGGYDQNQYTRCD